jgi:hypothetical protein
MRRMMKQYGNLAKAGRLKRFGKLGGGLPPGGDLPSS